MANRTRIPHEPSDLIDTTLRYSVAALRAARDLARTKPWLGTREEREAKVVACFEKFRDAYATPLSRARRAMIATASARATEAGRPEVAASFEAVADEPLTLRFDGPKYGCSGGSTYDGLKNQIVLTGRLSVLTLFQLFAYALGQDQARAQRWAATLFSRKFPISFGRCRLVGGLLVNDGRRDD